MFDAYCIECWGWCISAARNDAILRDNNITEYIVRVPLQTQSLDFTESDRLMDYLTE